MLEILERYACRSPKLDPGLTHEREPSCTDRRCCNGRCRYSQLSFSEPSELIGDGAHNPHCCPIIHRLSSEALADRVDGLVCARSRQAVLCTRTASFRGKPERQLQLHNRMRV